MWVSISGPQLPLVQNRRKSFPILSKWRVLLWNRDDNNRQMPCRPPLRPSNRWGGLPLVKNNRQGRSRYAERGIISSDCGLWNMQSCLWLELSRLPCLKGIPKGRVWNAKWRIVYRDGSDINRQWSGVWGLWWTGLPSTENMRKAWLRHPKRWVVFRDCGNVDR